MDLFNLAAKLTLDSSGFEKGVSDADHRGRGLADSLKGTFEKIKKVAASAISVAAVKKGIDTLMSFANEVSSVGDKIDKQSQALGLSRKAYQEWDYILGQNGASIDSLGVSMKTLNSAILSAGEGSKESMTAFRQLGLNVHEIETMNMEDQFDAVVRAFQKMPAGAQKSALAVKLFGRNGMELLPLLNQSETSLDELRARAEELGIIMSDDAVDASVAYNDALDDLNRTFNGLKYSVGAKLLPAMTTAFGRITSFAGKISKAYQENGLKGVWQTLVDDFKNIKWPTWDDVKTAVTQGWETIKNGIRGLAVLAFGEKVDGTINWPDVNVLLADFKTWWKDTALPAFQSAMVWTLKLFGVPQESAEQIASVIGGWWDNMVSTAESVLEWFLNLPGAPHDAGTQLHDIIVGWWKGVKDYAQGLLEWVFGIPTPKDKDGSGTGVLIKAWWDQNVVPKLKDALNFVLGLFDLPDVDSMKNQIVGWWIKVKDAVGELVLNIVPNILGIHTGDPASGEGTQLHDSGGGMTHGGGGHGFAKGLNYVPYDNFVAYLHRGEEILTASQARRRRNGESEFGISGMVADLSRAVREGVEGATVQSFLSGKDITDNVNRDTIRQLKARRFAT